MDDPKKEKPQITKPIDGCVVDWDKHVQINHKTGETYDFDGNPVKATKIKDDTK